MEDCVLKTGEELKSLLSQQLFFLCENPVGVDCKSCLWGSIFNRKLLIDSELTKHYTESVANIKYPEKHLKISLTLKSDK